MTSKVAALIPAAGEGVRLSRGPKAFVEIGGKTLLERAAQAFEGRVEEIIVAVAESLVSEAEQLLKGRAKVIAGGVSRQESVHKLLRAIEADIVLVHDAARPFLGAEVIAAIVRAVEHTGAASTVMAVADTLIKADTGAVVDREELRAVQTPQGFYRGLILSAHESALERGLTATDDAGLARAAGQPVVLVEGSAWLMKITTPADLEIARALAPAWDTRGGP